MEPEPSNRNDAHAGGDELNVAALRGRYVPENVSMVLDPSYVAWSHVPYTPVVFKSRSKYFRIWVIDLIRLLNWCMHVNIHSKMGDDPRVANIDPLTLRR